MTTLTLIAAAFIINPIQDPSMFAPPVELKQLAFMVGDWKSEGTGMGADPSQPMKIKGSASCKVSMDRWFEWNTKDDMEGFGQMTGKFMVTFNDTKKQFEGIWFDSITNYSMRMYGTVKANHLTMLSEEVPSHMGDGNTQYRISYELKTPNHIETKIDSKVQGEFVNMLTHQYKK